MTAQPILHNGRHQPETLAECEATAGDLHGWSFICPRCGGALSLDGSDRMVCEEHGRPFERIDGVWRFLPEERATYFREFMRDYETVRQLEGRSSDDPKYYRSLPFTDVTGRFSSDWRIRATTYRSFIERVIKPLEVALHRPLRVLDLGAGNGWLSNRLAERGHIVVAIDLTASSADGLGAHHHYLTHFTSMQAEFDRLPLGSLQADVAIFNGSIHYSTKFEATLQEALRVLRPEGMVVILDSPVYRDARSGATMVRERETRFTNEFGFPSNALPMENYLTFERLAETSATLGIRWNVHEPYYGLRWSLRPWLARIRGHREPARFVIITGFQNRVGAAVQNDMRRKVSRRWLRLTQRWKMRSLTRVKLEDVCGYSIVVMPNVFNPRLFRTGEFFATQLNQRLIPPGSRVLELGTGTGINAIVAARWAREVVAIDLNPIAVRCAEANALINGAEDRVTVRHGDLFNSVQGEKFDRILFNPPFFRGTPRTLADLAWRSEDVIERFAGEVKHYLAENGSALVILSSDGEESRFLSEFEDAGLAVQPGVRRDLGNEIFTIYQLSGTTRERDDHSV